MTHFKLSFFLLIISSLSFPVFSAVESAPETQSVSQIVEGKYGFDWLHPQRAKCRLIDAQLSKKLSGCRLSEIGSFSGKKGHWICKISGGEFLVYETLARCSEELEIMDANAP